MKPEDDGLVLMVKRDLLTVEASLLPIDGLYHEAERNHDPEKIRRYSDERASLIKARDRLQKEIENLEAFDVLQDHHRHAIASAWKSLKDDLVDIVTTHRR